MQSDKLDRAKQFLSFDALTGFRYFLSQSEKIDESKIDLSEDLSIIINKKISMLNKGMKVRIKYYYGSEYVETTGIIKKIDNIYKKIYLLNSKIDINDILDIDII